ncbi:MAG: sigma-70 family RNA polymerase sigma factor [Bacteroidota bacterium]
MNQHEVTVLLKELENGKTQGLDQLLPVVYEELRKLASSYMRRERANHTLNTTALVHEAYLNLVDQRQAKWQNRAHFFGIAAQAMRRILLMHARSRNAAKRGGGQHNVTFEEGQLAAQAKSEELIAIDDALSRLEKMDERMAKVVELRYFGGLNVEETAAAMGISTATVKREWRTAKAWLRQNMA